MIFKDLKISFLYIGKIFLIYAALPLNASLCKKISKKEKKITSKISSKHSLSQKKNIFNFKNLNASQEINHLNKPVFVSTTKTIYNLPQALLLSLDHPSLRSAWIQYAFEKKNIVLEEKKRTLPRIKINFFDLQNQYKGNSYSFENKVGADAGFNLEWDVFNLLNSNKKLVYSSSQEQYYDALETKKELYKKVTDCCLRIQNNQKNILLFKEKFKSLERLKITAQAEYKFGKADEGAMATLNTEIAECMYQLERYQSDLSDAESNLKSLTGASMVSSEFIIPEPDLSKITWEHVMDCAQKSPMIQKSLWRERKYEETLKIKNRKFMDISFKVGGDAGLFKNNYSTGSSVQKEIKHHINFELSKIFSPENALEKNKLTKDYDAAQKEKEQKKLKSIENAQIVWFQYLSSSRNLNVLANLIQAKIDQENFLKKYEKLGTYSLKDVLEAKKGLYQTQQRILEVQRERHLAVWNLFLFITDCLPDQEAGVDNKKNKINAKKQSLSDKPLLARKAYAY